MSECCVTAAGILTRRLKPCGPSITWAEAFSQSAAPRPAPG
jgi:hypothetical protein